MLGLLVKKGTEVLAVNYKDSSSASIVKKIIKEDVIYFREDIQIDPVGKLACHKGHNSIGGQFARQGFYGFNLPKNTKNYETMLVHKGDIITDM